MNIVERIQAWNQAEKEVKEEIRGHKVLVWLRENFESVVPRHLKDDDFPYFPSSFIIENAHVRIEGVFVYLSWNYSDNNGGVSHRYAYTFVFPQSLFTKPTKKAFDEWSQQQIEKSKRTDINKVRALMEVCGIKKEDL